jgi:hypothetical protein
LSEYLESAVALEREKHTLEQLRKELEGQRTERISAPPPPQYPSPPEAKKPSPPPSGPALPFGRFVSENLGDLGALAGFVGILAIVLGAAITLARKMPMLPFGILLIFLLFTVAMLLLLLYAHNNAGKKQNRYSQRIAMERVQEAKRVRAENEQAAREHEKKCETVKRKYEQEFRDAMAHNDNADFANAALGESQQTIEEEIRKLDETLTGLYGLNIVCPKYHNAVAFASFQEYLQSGRCDAFEGANGAYSIFEREVRSDAMVSQLKNLNAGLLQIGESQHKLYTEIAAANRRAAAMAEQVREKMSLFSDKQRQMSGELAAARHDSKRLATQVTGLESHLNRVSAQNAKIRDNIASLASKLKNS